MFYPGTVRRGSGPGGIGSAWGHVVPTWRDQGKRSKQIIFLRILFFQYISPVLFFVGFLSFSARLPQGFVLFVVLSCPVLSCPVLSCRFLLFTPARYRT